MEAFSKVHGNGKCVIPDSIRKLWDLKDGEFLMWSLDGNKVVVYPAELKAKKIDPIKMEIQAASRSE